MKEVSFWPSDMCDIGCAESNTSLRGKQHRMRRQSRQSPMQRRLSAVALVDVLASCDGTGGALKASASSTVSKTLKDDHMTKPHADDSRDKSAAPKDTDSPARRGFIGAAGKLAITGALGGAVHASRAADPNEHRRVARP
jgi:hypothetical protein